MTEQSDPEIIEMLMENIVMKITWEDGEVLKVSSEQEGGRLTEDQVEDLARYIEERFAYVLERRRFRAKH